MLDIKNKTILEHAFAENFGSPYFPMLAERYLKDGDLNTANGQTVNLLPFHGMSKYPYDNNEAYPNSKEFTDYRKNYNTRVVTTGSFKNAIRNYSKTSNP